MTLLLDTLDRTLFLDTLDRTHFLDTLTFYTKLSRKLTLQNERFTRDFHENLQSRLLKRAFYTSLSLTLTILTSKTSVLHETVTKTDTSDSQNERFTRDFHEN